MSRKHTSRASKVSKRRKKGMTRRQFLTDCALPTMTAYTMSPLVEGLLRHKTAMAEGSPVSTWIPTAHIHLSGGWGFNGTFVGRAADGNTLSRATIKNHGISDGFGTTLPADAIVTAFGGQMYNGTISDFTAGLLSQLSAEAQARVKLTIYHTESPDDNTTASDGISPLLTKAGMSGLVATAAGTVNSDTGNGTTGRVIDPAAQRLTVSRVADVLNALAFSRVLTNHGPGMLARIARGIAELSSERAAHIPGSKAELFKNTSSAATADFISKLEPTQGPEQLNPSQDPAIAGVYGLTPQTANQISGSGGVAVQAAMVKAALDGNIGPIAFRMGGYDYHQTAQTTTRARDNTAGVMVGRALQAAFNKGKPMIVWGTTDGGLAANLAFNLADGNSNQWQGDRQRYSGAFMFSIWPSGVAQPTVPNMGASDPTNGMLVQNTPTSTLRMASAHAFYNIAIASGKTAEAEQVLSQAGYTPGEIAAVKALPKIFG